MSVTPSRIRQIAIPVDSIEQAKEFYAGTLGLRHLFDAPPALSFFECGGVQLMLAGPAAQGAEGGSQHPVLYYDVEDIKTAHSRLQGAGAKVIEEPHVIARMSGREIWLSAVSDGQGNVVQLISDVVER
ncbi:MAG TPA: VOC family protein [Gemmatimonadaceae bacterium]|jgi:predicted enzyme related to lactoylglutathione lyase